MSPGMSRLTWHADRATCPTCPRVFPLRRSPGQNNRIVAVTEPISFRLTQAAIESFEVALDTDPSDSALAGQVTCECRNEMYFCECF